MTASDIYPLPTVPEQVTASWLGKVLGQNVKSAELIYSVLNATASKLFFTIEYEDDKNAEDQARYICSKGMYSRHGRLEQRRIHIQKSSSNSSSHYTPAHGAIFTPAILGLLHHAWA